ncbi:glycine-rich domain-containing protein [Tessaracoccus caeni]|uniref:hypothetical protein n=1 Tax=Tessaracoccus caeni TaxID=3031239 RepID=UPI0023DCDA5B|nr:hypothetical protein [Tessaracoccus caeni]MDF1487877.1 hypothetical protein [Tessaracoccus caeni]
MIDDTKPSWSYFTDEEILSILEISRLQFREAWQDGYIISDERVLSGLTHINDSNDYVKIVWRVQQENPHDARYFDRDYLARGITNLKLFYALEIVDGKNLHSLSKTLDEFWHAHQNFSRDYTNFCDTAFGPNQTLHHLPTDKRDLAIQEAMEARYQYTRQMLEKIAIRDDDFWGNDIVICCSDDTAVPEGFIFWRPALIAIEPACRMYDDDRLNQALRKKTNFVLEGFASLK